MVADEFPGDAKVHEACQGSLDGGVCQTLLDGGGGGR